MQKSVRFRAFIISIFFHLLLLLLLMFAVLHMPDPPMGGGEGMIVNLGYAVEGSGDIQPLSEEVTTEVPVKETPPPPPDPVPENTDFVTQENEESEKIEVEKKSPKEEVKKPEKKHEKKHEKKTEHKKPEKETPKVNPESMYKGKKNNASSQGNDANKKGDKGDPKGDPNSTYYGKSGTGNTPGSGDGNGSGQGSGNGKGNGKGPQVDLRGRKIQNLKDINIHDVSQETGIVVVTITVDKYGKVSKAIPGGRGSNTTSATLYKKAQQAAMNAKFDAQPGAAEEQRGTITFNFIVR